MHYKLPEKLKKTFFTIATNSIKYFGLTITQQMKDLYGKNFKSLKKEIEEGIRTKKDPHTNGLIGLA